MPIFAVTKKCEFINFIVPVTKNPTVFTAILHPFGPGRQNLCMRFEFGLHMPVEFYLDPLRFAIVIREKLILSKYILHCQAFA